MHADTRFAYEALPARVLFGEGTLSEVGDEAERLGTRSAVVFASGRHRDAVEEVTKALSGVPVEVFGDVRPHVPADLAAAATGFVELHDADTVVSIGGGSSVGLAKAVARRRQVRIVAVPTTYAGSEMTPVWGQTQEGEKRTGVDPAVLPDVVVYDPRLSRTLPAGIAGVSGLNGVAHCVEAFYAPKANPVTEVLAAEGLRLLVENLPQVVAGAEEARPATLLGACLAGLALAQAGASFHHKVCHVLGGRFDLPHAETHAALLPHSMRVAADAYPRAVRRMGEAIGDRAPVDVVTRLADDVGAPASLAELGLAAADLPAAEEAAAAVVVRTGGLSHAQVEQLLRSAHAGRG